MKSAYELAMERLNQSAPTVKLNARQKEELAELDTKYAALIAGREIALKSEIAKVADDTDKADALREQLVNERKNCRPSWKIKKRMCGKQIPVE